MVSFKVPVLTQTHVDKLNEPVRGYVDDALRLILRQVTEDNLVVDRVYTLIGQNRVDDYHVVGGGRWPLREQS